MHTLPDRFTRITVDEAFQTHAGFTVSDRPTLGGLREALSQKRIAHAPGDDWNDLFHRAFLARVEPALRALPEPFFLTHYPTALGSLARDCASHPGTAERTELYLNGMELANGFGELTDACEQRRRFERDSVVRRHQGLRAYPLDEAFLVALDSLQQAAGMALGFDRMLMALVDAADMDEVTFLPWMQP